MVLTKSELIASLQNEVRILLHLAGKIDRSMLDYRPTPKQRSMIELLKYLTVMGPSLVHAAKAGTFDEKYLDGRGRGLQGERLRSDAGCARGAVGDLRHAPRRHPGCRLPHRD